MKRIIVAILGCLLAFEFIGCIEDENIKLGYRGDQPVQENDGWVISSPENENMDAALIESAFHPGE